MLGWGHFLLAFWGNEVPFLLTDYALKYVQMRVIGLLESTGGGGMLDLDGIRRQIALSIVTLLIAFVGGHVTARIFAARDGLLTRQQRCCVTQAEKGLSCLARQPASLFFFIAGLIV